MTIRIKPSGVTPTSTASVSSAQGAENVAKTSSSTSVQSSSLKGMEAIVDGLRTRQISPSQAVQQLVDVAMQQGIVGLQPGNREHIEKMVRATIESDPAIAALIKDLERAS